MHTRRAVKTRMVWHWQPDFEKNFKDVFIRFDRMYERDRQSDRQTDTHTRTDTARMMA